MSCLSNLLSNSISLVISIPFSCCRRPISNPAIRAIVNTSLFEISKPIAQATLAEIASVGVSERKSKRRGIEAKLKVASSKRAVLTNKGAIDRSVGIKPIYDAAATYDSEINKLLGTSLMRPGVHQVPARSRCSVRQWEEPKGFGCFLSCLIRCISCWQRISNWLSCIVWR